MKPSTMKAILKALHILLLVTVSVASQAAVESNTYILTDHLGSPILATDDNGDTLWQEDYQPYGAQLTNEDGDNSVGFTGHKDDKALGVTYMQGRWYHQEMGRFLAIDPVRFVEVNPITFNRYAYANNNPYKYIDPDGRTTAIPTLVILGIVITVAVSPEILITTSPGNSSQASSQTEGFLYHTGTNDDSGGYEMPDFEFPTWVSNEESGSYVNGHESGKVYVGKGSRARSQKSGRREEKLNEDQHIWTWWESADSNREGFKAESEKLEDYGGAEDDGNYNRRESPGKKYREHDGD